MTAWEYLIVALPTFREARVMQGESASVEVLNQDGGEGWEAIGMTALNDGTVAVLLKRPKAGDDVGQGRPGDPRSPR